jgi:hypothetical protein
MPSPLGIHIRFDQGAGRFEMTLQLSLVTAPKCLDNGRGVLPPKILRRAQGGMRRHPAGDQE